MRVRALVLVLLLALGLAGCGKGAALTAEDLRDRAETLRDDFETRADELSKELRERRERIVARVEQVIGELKPTLPAPPRTRPEVQRRAGEQSTEQFLTSVIEDVDAYWTTTLKAAGRPEPRVSYAFIAPGERRATACSVADDDAAFYCPGDDTIYIADAFAAALYRGVARLPNGRGEAAGSFGVAYVVAHEYGHNIQDELGIFEVTRTRTAEPFELQADCLAGSWGNSAFAQGGLTDEDIRQAIATVESVGDFDFGNAQHHGTPAQRRDAWLTGFRGGDPAACTRFVPQV